MVKIRYLATLYEAVGHFEEEHNCSKKNCTVRELLFELMEKYPQLVDHLGKNLEFVGDDVKVLVNGRNIDFLNGLNTRLSEQDIVVLIPPAAGGLIAGDGL